MGPIDPAVLSFFLCILTSLLISFGFDRHGPKTDPMSSVFYNAHGQAANISRELTANGTETLDLSHVRWGRIDYLNATELMTRWIIFK